MVLVAAHHLTIPDQLDINWDINVPSKFEGHGFGRCKIENPVKVQLLGYENETEHQFYYTTSIMFGGKCLQGIGWQNFSTTGMTLTEFKTKIKQDSKTRALQIYNKDTNLTKGGINWKRGKW